MTVKKFSPCKINIMLAITGQRSDGFHNLTSIVTPVKFGDTLEAEMLPQSAVADTLSCNAPDVPCDATNIVMKAAALFRQATNIDRFYAFNLQKRVPAGAGLGGGSSNAVAALEAMNELNSSPLDVDALEELAATLGSDCPLFLSRKPVVMRGRGDIVFPLGGEAAERISGLKLLLFKPAFSINTGWAYSMMRQNPADYMDPDKAEDILSAWLENPLMAQLPLVNNMQIEAFKKYPALEIVLENIRSKFGIDALMSGSGSACFAIVNNLDDRRLGELKTYIKETLGQSAFVEEA